MKRSLSSTRSWVGVHLVLGQQAGESTMVTMVTFGISPNHPKRDHYKYNNELSPLKQASVVVLDRPVYKTAKVVIKAKKWNRKPKTAITTPNHPSHTTSPRIVLPETRIVAEGVCQIRIRFQLSLDALQETSCVKDECFTKNSELLKPDRSWRWLGARPHVPCTCNQSHMNIVLGLYIVIY